MKLLKVLSCVPTLPISFYKKTESYMFCRLYSNLSPKNDLTTVRPAIFELNYIELIVSGVVFSGLVAIS